MLTGLEGTLSVVVTGIVVGVCVKAWDSRTNVSKEVFLDKMTTLHKARADAWTKHDKLCAHNQRDIKDDLTALKASYDDISKQMNQVVRTKDLWDLAEMMQGKKPWKPS